MSAVVHQILPVGQFAPPCVQCNDPHECAERRQCQRRVDLAATRELASGITNLNARRMARVEAGVHVLIVLAGAVAFAWALAEFMTPCAEGVLCMSAMVRPTRIRPLLRLRMALRAAYLRMLIRACEQDIAWHEETQLMAPQQEALARLRAEELRVQLIDCELCTRSN